MLKVEPRSKSPTANTYKFMYALLEDGDIKDLIRFLDAFEEISEIKLLLTENSKFAFFRTLLTGAGLEKWNRAVHNCTWKTQTDNKSNETKPPRKTEETFKLTKLE